MTAKPAIQFKITNRPQDSKVYLVTREDEESFICVGRQHIEDACCAEWEGDCDYFEENTWGELECYWHDLAMGDSLKVKAREIEMYGMVELLK